MDPSIFSELTLDGTATQLETDPLELSAFYFPLARRLLNEATPERRFVIGIAGPPAVGKTAFSTILTAVVNHLSGLRCACMVSLDGWHYPNAYLDTHTVTRGFQTIPLRRIKGAPETFDARAAFTFLQAIQATPTLSFPTYSRMHHDPLPAGGLITSSDRLVFFEGNYLLLNLPGWKEFKGYFHRSIFLTAPRESILGALRERHLRGGKSAEDVDRHIVFSDEPNLDLILTHSQEADFKVIKRDSRRIQQVVYPES